MDDGAYFMVESDELHSFEGQDELGEDVRSALQNNLGLAVGEKVLPIAHWQHEATGPLSVSLNAAGELVVLVSAEKFDDQPSMLSTLSALEQWLTPMGFRELSEMSGSPSRFVEGVRSLCPDSPMVLASMLRILLINPSIAVDQGACEAALPFCRLETLRIETFRTDEGAVAIRKVFENGTVSTVETPTKATEAEVEVDRVDIEVELDDFEDATLLFADATELEEVDDSEGSEPQNVASIDLTTDTPDDGGPLLLKGNSYSVAELPRRFDLTKKRLTPVSDEMFTVGSHLALVVDLDLTKGSPFEKSSMFRWDGTERQHHLFERHSTDDEGRRRTVHLFVEGSEEADRVSYIGQVVHAHESSSDPDHELWFELEPRAALVH